MSPSDGHTEGIGMRSVITTSGVAVADDPCFGVAHMPIARIIGRGTTNLDESGHHEWVIPESAMHVNVGVAMAIVRSSLTDHELTDTNTVCVSRSTGNGTQRVPNTMQRNGTSQLRHGSSSTGLRHTWPGLQVLDDSKILRGRC